MAKSRIVISHGITYKTTKGYPRFSSGPLRHQYVHRVIAAAMLGRELKKDEEVHHIDADKRNCHFLNLHVMGEVDHGWVTTKQCWFMKNRDEGEKKRWDAFINEEAERQKKEIAAAKGNSEEWNYQDGEIDQRYTAYSETQPECVEQPVEGASGYSESCAAGG